MKITQKSLISLPKNFYSYPARIGRDKLGYWGMLVLTWALILFLIAIAIGLVVRSLPILKTNSIVDLLFSTEWYPSMGKFGLLPYIVSTLYVTGVAVGIAIPFCLFTAIYLSEYADKALIKWINPLIDILAGIPSVIFGVWGILIVVPLVRDHISPFFGVDSTGYTILSGGIVLSIMVAPVIIHVLLEVFATIPADLRNASLSLGATKWQTVKFVVLKKASPGIISAVVLGLSRAFGETLAVLMVVGNVASMPSSPLEAGYPLPALIANNYGEMLSIPLYDSVLLLSALVLFIIVLVFNIISRLILRRLENKIA